MKKILVVAFIVLLIGGPIITPLINSDLAFAATAGDSCKCPGDPDSGPFTGVVTTDTAILSACDCLGPTRRNQGGEVLYILNLIVDIMTIGIGILGVIGITIVGIQYLTAGGNEEKTRKAKRRMFEIVIGLVAYVVIYAFLKWLMPGMPN